MRLGLAGRMAIVSGGSKGIGEAIAHELAGEGAAVCLLARGREALEHVVADIHERGGQALAVACDVAEKDSVGAAVETAVQRFGRIDVLVNNAGGAGVFGALDELTDADWLGAFQINVLGALHLTQSCLPWLRKSDAPRIINIASVSGLEPGRHNPHYSASKAALLNLSKHLANVLTADGILVNAVCPGPVHSAAWLTRASEEADRHGLTVEESLRRIDAADGANVPLGRIGSGGDVSGLVAYLASDRASWTTGACFTVDGGKRRAIG